MFSFHYLRVIFTHVWVILTKIFNEYHPDPSKIDSNAGEIFTKLIDNVPEHKLMILNNCTDFSMKFTHTEV